MRQTIVAYRENRIRLDRLVRELTSRISALESVSDSEWVEELRTFRNNLEYVNAFWIDSGRSALTEQESQAVDEVLGELEAMLIEY